MNRKSKVLGGVFIASTALSALLILAAIAYLLGEIALEGRHVLSWEFLTQPPREGMTAGGIFPAIVGTVFMVLIMSVAGVPVGIITAVYLTEYARQDSVVSKVIRFGVNTLAGVPSIVFGLFGLGFFIQFVGKGVDSVFYGGGELHWAQPNILWASLTMALLTLPVVIVAVEESLRAVPDDLRAGSLALGATKWQTIRKIVLPNSVSGILTGTILAVSRGAGEVAPILFTGAAYFLPHLPGALSDQFMHLGYHVYIMATQSPDVEATRGLQYGTTLVLLLLTFSLNAAGVFARYRFRKRSMAV